MPHAETDPVLGWRVPGLVAVGRLPGRRLVVRFVVAGRKVQGEAAMQVTNERSWTEYK